METTTKPQQMVFVGKCRECRKFHRAVLDVVTVQTKTGPAPWRIPMNVGFTLRHADGREHRAAKNTCGEFVFGVRCACSPVGWVVMSKVRATVTEHECGSACRNAKGANCECSCGGAHHGEDV
jgi:hypothetical protein